MEKSLKTFFLIVGNWWAPLHSGRIFFSIKDFPWISKTGALPRRGQRMKWEEETLEETEENTNVRNNEDVTFEMIKDP